MTAGRATGRVLYTPRFHYDDGGRAEAGFKGEAPGDCVTRSIAIVTGRDYRETYDLINEASKEYDRTHRRPTRYGGQSARKGVDNRVIRQLLADLGLAWHPTMVIGSGTTVHLRREELPGGRLIARASKHLVAVVHGVIHDAFDPSRDGTRAVYGYWTETVEPLASRG